MATSIQLTAAYRRRALAAKAAALLDVVKLWPLIDLDDIDRSWPAVMRALELIVADGRSTVASAAADYLRQMRDLQNPTADLDILPASSPDPLALAASLTATGPATIKDAISRGLTAAAAADRALTVLSGAVARTVLNGGRDTVIQTIEASGVYRWMRVTHGKTCWFCAMLASRGPVYHSRATAGDARGRPGRFHDHCDCTIEPVLVADPVVPASIQRYDELWSRTTAGLSGADARNAFRLAYEATAAAVAA